MEMELQENMVPSDKVNPDFKWNRSHLIWVRTEFPAW